MQWFEKVNNEFGKRPMKHNGMEVLTRTQNQSIQGQWNDSMWNQYPKHLMEPKREIPMHMVPMKPDKPILEKQVRPHRNTKVIRKKYAFEDKNF